MSRTDIETQLDQVAAALKALPLQPEAAWRRVRARVYGHTPAPRWPLALSLSLVVAMFVVANLGSFRQHMAPTLSEAWTPPAPARAALTPTPVGWTRPAVGSDATVAPPVGSRESTRAATPIPLPPDS